MTAIFPGSFDPFTLGHLEIAERAAKLFDRLIIAVSFDDKTKNHLFAPAERLMFAKESAAHIDNAEAVPLCGLLSVFAEMNNAGVIVRGIRASSDCEIEIQRSRINRMLAGSVETVLMVSDPALSHVSGSAAREIIKAGIPDPSVLSRLIPQAALSAVVKRHLDAKG